MGHRSLGYGYPAVMVGGVLSITSHSPQTGLVAGAATWALACLYGALARTAPPPGTPAHLAAEDFRRRWHSLSGPR